VRIAVLALENGDRARGHGHLGGIFGGQQRRSPLGPRGFPAACAGNRLDGLLLRGGALAQQDIVVWQPGCDQGGALRSSPRSRSMSGRTTWDSIFAHRYAEVLPRTIAQAARDFSARRRAASSRPRLREELAIDATNRAMPGTVGRIYSERYFPALEQGAPRNRSSITWSWLSAKRVAASEWMTARVENAPRSPS